VSFLQYDAMVHVGFSAKRHLQFWFKNRKLNCHRDTIHVLRSVCAKSGLWSLEVTGDSSSADQCGGYKLLLEF